MSASTASHLELIGDEHIPAKDGVMVIPNRLQFQDLLHLEKSFESRRVVFLIERGFGYDPLLQAHLEKDDVEAIEFASEVSGVVNSTTTSTSGRISARSVPSAGVAHLTPTFV